MKMFYFLIIFFPFFTFSQQIYKIETFTPLKNQEGFQYQKILEIENMKIDYRTTVKSKEHTKNISHTTSAPRVWLNDIALFSGIWTGFIKDKKVINPFFPYLIKNIYPAENNNERIFVEEFWETEHGNFSIKIIKYKDVPNWVFGKIEAVYPVGTISFLGTTPGPTYPVPGREVWCYFNQSGPSIVDKDKTPVSKEGDFALALINKGVKDINLKRMAKFFVFLENEIKSITIKPSTAITIEVIPKENIKSVSFACGYWFDRSDPKNEEKPLKVLNEFLNNKSIEIKNKLISTDWNANYKGWKDIEELIKKIDKYSKKSCLSELMNKYNFEGIKEAFKHAEIEEDYRKAIDIEDKLKEIKEQMYEILTNDLKTL